MNECVIIFGQIYMWIDCRTVEIRSGVCITAVQQLDILKL